MMRLLSFLIVGAAAEVLQPPQDARIDAFDVWRNNSAILPPGIARWPVSHKSHISINHVTGKKMHGTHVYLMREFHGVPHLLVHMRAGPRGQSVAKGMTRHDSYKIGVPGGGLEATDRSAWHCALRELYEETGIRLTDMNILGVPRLDTAGGRNEFFIYLDPVTPPPSTKHSVSSDETAPWSSKWLNRECRLSKYNGHTVGEYFDKMGYYAGLHHRWVSENDLQFILSHAHKNVEGKLTLGFVLLNYDDPEERKEKEDRGEETDINFRNRALRKEFFSLYPSVESYDKQIAQAMLSTQKDSEVGIRKPSTDEHGVYGPLKREERRELQQREIYQDDQMRQAWFNAHPGYIRAMMDRNDRIESKVIQNGGSQILSEELAHSASKLDENSFRNRKQARGKNHRHHRNRFISRLKHLIK